MAGLLDAEDALYPSDDFVGGRVGGFVEVYYAVGEVGGELAGEGRRTGGDGSVVACADVELDLFLWLVFDDVFVDVFVDVCVFPCWCSFLHSFTSFFFHIVFRSHRFSFTYLIVILEKKRPFTSV